MMHKNQKKTGTLRIAKEDLGGAQMHAEISGTVDFHEKDDPSCLKRVRALLDLLPRKETPIASGGETEKDPQNLYKIIDPDGRREYDVHEVLACIIDKGSMQEYKAEYGKTLLTAYAKLGGRPVAIVANQHLKCQSKTEGIQIGGVIYSDSADKAARFIMDCNETGLPIIFLQDVQGFMVGRDAEHSGIIRSGAKLVNAVSNCVVPKITVITGGSFGAGNYAMCGKAFDPRFIFAWPNARYSVMGGEQASDTLFAILQRQKGKEKSGEEHEEIRKKVKANYEEQMNIRYGAARGWIDAIIQPHETRQILLNTLSLVSREPPQHRFHTGVLQV